MREFELVPPRTGRCVGDLDPPHAAPDQGAQFQQLQSDRAAGGLGKLRERQTDAAQRAEQYVGHRGKPEPQLVGLHGRGGRAVGEQVELALLDAVFHLAAGTVDLLIEMPCANLARCERRDNKARVGLAAGDFGLADDAPFAAPTVTCAVSEVLEAACRLVGADALSIVAAISSGMMA
jgi:hypothetical protein